MLSLNTEQRALLLDYCFGCVSDAQADEARVLIAGHGGASDFYERLCHSLGALDHLGDDESCPDHLAECTFSKIAEHDAATAGTLGELLEAEQSKVATTRPSFWRSFAEVAAVAAAILIFSGVYVPFTRNMRANSQAQQCRANLAGINQAFIRYADDHENALPAVAVAAGAPWWKVGAQGDENQSNTRHLWLLVQDRYVEPEQFVCAGRTEGRAVQLDRSLVKKYKDFPQRRYITYSFKFICDQNRKGWPEEATVLMADRNPVFESIDCSEKKFTPVKLSDKLMSVNSRNHRGAGQNVMFSDGSVRFVKQRTVGIANDDIFTVQQALDSYQGVEVPSGEMDTFLVP